VDRAALFMHYTQSENITAFVNAFEFLQINNQMLADFYISEYWDESIKDWSYDRITDNVVKEIETDVMYNSFDN
jgi:hypothetical protein